MSQPMPQSDNNNVKSVLYLIGTLPFLHKKIHSNSS